MRSKNTRTVVHLKTVIYDAIVVEAEATGFSVADVINRVLYDAGYGKAVAKAAAKAEKPGKPEDEFGPGYPWEGDPNDDPNYAAPHHRMAGYKRANRTDEEILEIEARIKRKYPRAITIHDYLEEN